MTLSNELPTSAFYTNPELLIAPIRSPSIIWSWWWNSPNIELGVILSSETPTVSDLSGLTVLIVDKGAKIGDVLLKSPLLVQLRKTRDGVLSETWLEGVYEYGSGQDDPEAITDLLISLAEYRKALEKRGTKLGGTARRELDALLMLIQPDETT